MGSQSWKMSREAKQLHRRCGDGQASCTAGFRSSVPCTALCFQNDCRAAEVRPQPLFGMARLRADGFSAPYDTADYTTQASTSADTHRWGRLLDHGVEPDLRAERVGQVW